MVFHRLVKKLELFQKHVGKIDELCPVVKQYIVVSASHVVAHTTADAGILDRRLVRVRETVNAIKGIDRSGPDKTQILSLLVCPIVFARTGNIDRTRGNHRDKFVLVERQRILVIAVFAEVTTEPVRKGIVYNVGGLAEFPS